MINALIRLGRRSPVNSRRVLRSVTSLVVATLVTRTSASGAPSHPIRRPSSIVIPNSDKLFPLAMPGSQEVTVPGGRVRIAELRGWLRSVPATCDPKDGTWYYLLEVDPGWADSVGLSLADILTVGNITGLVNYPESEPPGMVVGPPLVRIEIVGWNVRRLDRRVAPPGWSFARQGECAGYRYAFDPLPLAPSGPELRVGSYVRVVGSIVSDSPHATKAAVGAWIVRTFGVAVAPEHRIYAAQSIWSEGAENDPRNPARWTEIHPADSIEVLPTRSPTESVVGVAVALVQHFFSMESGGSNLWVSPPAPRPAWATGIRVVEVPLAASPGEASEPGTSGACLFAEGSKIRIHIDLRAARLNRFAAIFRASWTDGVSSWTVRHRPPQ